MATEDPMTQIMENDDGVDALCDLAVIDVWVRQRLWQDYQQYHRGRRDFADKDETDQALGVLKRMQPCAFPNWLAKWADWSTVRELQPNNYVLFELWEMRTKDSMTHDEMMDNGRKQLKSKLRGSLGMWADEIIRHRVDALQGLTNEELAERWEIDLEMTPVESAD